MDDGSSTHSVVARENGKPVPHRASVERTRHRPPATPPPLAPLLAAVTRGLPRAERKALGKAARGKTPLRSHAKLRLAEGGRHVVTYMEVSNEGRIPELVPLRHARMLVSPFTFFRGSAGLMAADLARTPSSGLRVQICGDCHIHNFGAYATPERKVVVDLNDFDETLPGPWEWDVKRLAASLVLAVADRGFRSDLGREAVLAMVGAYRRRLAELSEMTTLEAWYTQFDPDRLRELSSPASAKRREKQLAQGRAKSAPEVLMGKLTVETERGLRFKDMPPMVSHTEGVGAGEDEKAAFEAYGRTLIDDRRFLLEKFELVDIALRVVGVGSVGMTCGMLLLVNAEDDVLVLQLKEARRSVLEPFLGQSRHSHCGERVVSGQRLMQAASDMFLGWATGPRPPHRHYFVRQLRDVKIGVDTALWTKQDFRSTPIITGELLARAHSRSGDPSALRGYVGKTVELDEAIADYALAYARQVEKDHARFAKACRSGRLPVQQGD